MRRGILALAGSVALVMAGTAGVSQAAQTSPERGFAVAAIEPASGSVVGVGYPVIVTFAGPVADRVAAERGIHIAVSDKAAHGTPHGHFEWVSADVVQWIPDGYWSPHSKISVDAHGMSTGFETGDAVMAVADISDHTFTVSVNGEVVKVMPASMGKPKRPTPIGSFTALSKERSIKFDSRTIGIPLNDPEGYLIDGQYGVRVTWGGVYVHSAPWSVGSQGYANVSHGCINLSPDNAAWYFDSVHLGDPIIVQA
ncbi:L,D-transpeptidase [[Mycobacterium] nativiensis]|uniref:L,D-transpeptidase n=1 Tax=[Mycobacterium] nativiensis TaxID=2855503 RepID=A0ABU5Y076_9MYCO|nr:L,D-transpeptidase [Mycolicibacter sp. MYC340]MEB3033649.1 L,D-transpeptidase [Mycolicibacter sp. MYC340]